MAVTYFPVSGDYRGFGVGQMLNAHVLFTPVFTPVGIADALSVSPPLGFVPAPILARIKGGALYQLDGASTVQLLAGTADLTLLSSLSYLVSFENFTVTTISPLTGVSRSRKVVVSPFRFAASTDVTPVDLISVARL